MSDLISRQNAIDALEMGAEMLKRMLDDTDIVGSERDKFAWKLELIESFISDMKELPSAQPERKRGAWIVIDDAEREYQCDECKAMSYVLGNFCPNCGANMRGEQDD